MSFDLVKLIYGETTAAKDKPGQRCCDNCDCERFPVEMVKVTKVQQGLKHGKKKKVPPEESGYIINKLRAWRDDELMTMHYGNLTSLPSTTLMSNNVIEKIANCSSWVCSYDELRQNVLWAFGHSIPTGGLNKYGEMLMEELEKIYKVLDENNLCVKEAEKRAAREKEIWEAEERYQANTGVFNVLTEADFQ